MLRKAAVLVQKNWRRLQVSREYRKMKRGFIRLQATFRGRKVRRWYLRTRSKIILFQVCCEYDYNKDLYTYTASLQRMGSQRYMQT